MKAQDELVELLKEINSKSNEMVQGIKDSQFSES